MCRISGLWRRFWEAVWFLEDKGTRDRTETRPRDASWPMHSTRLCVQLTKCGIKSLMASLCSCAIQPNCRWLLIWISTSKCLLLIVDSGQARRIIRHVRLNRDSSWFGQDKTRFPSERTQFFTECIPSMCLGYRFLLAAHSILLMCYVYVHHTGVGLNVYLYRQLLFVRPSCNIPVSQFSKPCPLWVFCYGLH